jgi:hypothetical protein
VGSFGHNETTLSIAPYRSVPPVGPLILGSIDALRCGLELCSRAVCRSPDSCAAVHSSFADSRRASAETPDPISHSFHTTRMLSSPCSRWTARSGESTCRQRRSEASPTSAPKEPCPQGRARELGRRRRGAGSTCPTRRTLRSRRQRNAPNRTAADPPVNSPERFRGTSRTRRRGQVPCRVPVRNT